MRFTEVSQVLKGEHVLSDDTCFLFLDSGKLGKTNACDHRTFTKLPETCVYFRHNRMNSQQYRASCLTFAFHGVDSATGLKWWSPLLRQQRKLPR